MKKSRSARRAEMPFARRCWERQIAVCLAMLLAAPFGEAATLLQKGTTARQTVPSPSPATAPDSGGGSTMDTEALAQAPPSSSSQDATAAQTSQTPPNAPQPQNNPPPLGTAAAPVESTVGVPASRPAGAAIAPAKQKRTRVILISIGILVGAAVALGTVIGLSNASPSRP